MEINQQAAEIEDNLDLEIDTYEIDRKMTLSPRAFLNIVRIALIPFIVLFYVGAVAWDESEFFFTWGKMIAFFLFLTSLLLGGLEMQVLRRMQNDAKNQTLEISPEGTPSTPFNFIGNELKNSSLDKKLSTIACVASVFIGFLLVALDSRLHSEVANIMPPLAGYTVSFLILATIFFLHGDRDNNSYARWRYALKSTAVAMFLFYAANLNHRVISPGVFLDVYQYLTWATMVGAFAILCISTGKDIYERQQAKQQSGAVEEMDTDEPVIQ